MALALQWFLTPSTATAAIFALVTSVLLHRARKHYRAVPLLPAIPPGKTPPDCMVVIPARNEEGVVGGAVKSFPPDTVIVVDDHSTDRTAEESREAGAGVLEAPPLIKGASGKANACMAGARILTSRWILFADADTRYQKGFLDSMVEYADASGVALLSAHLTPRPESLAEALIEPYIAAVFFSGASLQRDPAAMFNGQCILARREAYEFIGGHAAVWKYLAEDVKLALLARRHRLSFAVARAADLGHVRSYTGWKGAMSGIERNAFRFVQVHPWTSLMILLTALCAALWLPVAAWLWFTGHRVAPAILLLLVLLELWPWYGNGLRVLLAPLAIYAALPLLLHGVVSALADRHIEWKGRTVRST
jgi:glycosyltransferase involved in cell wall biosynthesis